MRWRRRLALGITGKLLLVNLLVFAAFGGVVALVSLSFRNIEGLLTTTIVGDVNENIENAGLLRELSTVFAEANLLASTFSKDEEGLKARGDRLVEAVRQLERRSTHLWLKESLDEFSLELRRLFEQCGEINRILERAGSEERRLHSNLSGLEKTVSEGKIRQILAGEDPTFMEQLSILVSGYQETFLQINVLLLRWGMERHAASQPRSAKPLLSSIDELAIRFRTLTASEPQIAAYGPRLLQILGSYRGTVVEYQRAMEELDRRLAITEVAKSRVIGVMAGIDQDIAASTLTLRRKISGVMHDTGTYIIAASVAILLLMAGLTFLFIVSNIRRPIAIIKSGIEAIREGRLDTRIALSSGDEWGVIEQALNRMARDLATQGRARERLEEQLRQSQKMEAIGTLAGGIAHDFNNILTAVIGNVSLLQYELPEGHSLRGHVDDILSSSEKAATLTRHLLAFSRKQVIKPRPVALNDVVRRMKALLVRVIGEDIEFRTVLTDEALTVLADSAQIEQVLLNLATNARDAMPGGGTLTVETERVHVSGDRSFGELEPGSYALLSLSDTGQGMDEATRTRIFEPFFTTKEVGKGTGLGLSMAYGIIKQHKGDIRVYSEPGQGTTFKIYLKTIEASASMPLVSALTPSPVLQGGTETILVAEDDADVRKLVKKVLTGFGYRVIEAVDGEDAVQRFMENHDEIRLLIMDLVMPKKNGKEAWEEIKRVKGDVAVLFSSGYTAEIMSRKGIMEEGIHFLPKPVVPEALLAKVRQLLRR